MPVAALFPQQCDGMPQFGERFVRPGLCQIRREEWPAVERGAARRLGELESRVGQRPESADCSGDLEGKPGKTVDCTIVAGPETTPFTLTVTTVEGSTINYRYEPKA